ncbi:hypothetical protein PIIN_07831 [Serendipita indica DSM 11827]|uniref:F-box domain-containing protein n=1 Tax=Serendipita indica (strain DSM 11827) TaxID=1109443 RepID=G4TRD5_SERID|nr:hypothetical protein PIIN_07831 [Serendipita indica DSM 11827]
MSRPRRSISRKDYSELEELDGAREYELSAIGQELIYPLEPFPSDQEVAKARIATRDGESKLIRLNTRRERILSQLEDIENERMMVENELVVPRSIVTRLRDIPQEVLSMIFEACTEDPDFSPWTVMQINRKWRSVALHTRSLWSKICIFNDRSHHFMRKSRSARQDAGYELCDSLSRLQLAVARSAGGPLDIILDVLGYDTSIRWYNPDQKRRTIELITCLKSVEGRIRTLDLRESNCRLVDDLPFEDISLPFLESAMVHGRMKELLKRIWTTAPNLRRLSYSLDRNTELNLNLPAGNRITDLRIHGGNHTRSDKMEVSEHLAQAIISAECLTHLTLNGLFIYAPSRQTTLFHPELRHLKLVNVQLWRILELPLLESLDMGFCTTFESDARTLILPSLLSLTLDQIVNYHNAKINAPMLQELTINGRSSSPQLTVFLDLAEMCLRTGHALLRKLVLHDCDMKTWVRQCIDTLDGFPQLEELILSKTILTKSFFDAFAGGILGTKFEPYRKPPICVALKTFRVSLIDIPHRSTDKAMRKWIPKALKARARRGYPLEMASMRENDTEGWKSLM